MCIASLDEKRDSCSKTLHCASDVQYKMGNVGIYALLRGLPSD